MPKVSVIVPVFGVEQYIEKCARSLFAQTLKDLEIIFVDDCTMDKSIEIVKKVLIDYPERQHQTIFILHESNRGLPSARKTGIQNAQGEYIAHCDADDWVELDTYELMYEKAKAEDSDIVMSDYFRFTNGNVTKCKGGKESLNSIEVFRGMLFHDVPYMVWNKLIKRGLYDNDIIFPTETHAEDMALIIQLSYYAKKITYLQRAFYYYVVNSNTALHVYTEETCMRKFNQSVANVRLLELFFSKTTYDAVINNGIISLKLAQRDKLISLLNNPKYYKIWSETFPEINKLILFNKDIKFKYKLKYYLTKYRIYKFKS